MKRGRVTRAIVGAARGTLVARLLRRRQSEAQLRRIFEGMAIGVALIDAEGRLVESNPAFEEMLGYTGGELRGLYFAELGYSGDTAEDSRLYRELLQGGRNHYQLEKRYVKKSGELLWGRLTVSLLRGNGETGSEPPLTIGMLEDVTERRRAEEALKKSEERFHNLVENAGDAFFVHDLDGRFVDANQWACDSLGYTREELLGLSVTDIEKNFDPAALPELWGQVVAGVPITLDGRHRRKDGSTFPVEVRLGVFETGGRQLMLALARDVTERERAQAALWESETRFRQLFEHSVDALLVHDEEGRMVDCNSEACRSLGYTREELLELSVKDFVEDLLTEEEKRELGENAPWRKALSGEPGATVNFHQNRHRRKDGTTFPVEVGVGSIDYGRRRLIFASARDITERRELEKRLSYQAFHDPLTGLSNRTLFLDRLGHALARTDRREDSVAVLFLDLDNFKVINDSLGHGAGDDLLVATARRLTTCLRPGDTVARLGGDEFTVLLEDVAGKEEVERVVSRLMDGLAAPFEIAGSEIFVTASVGVVVKASPDSNPEDLLHEADLAMYRAKESGKARYEIYEEAMSDRADERLDLERDLRRALATGEEFEVHYQPKILLQTGEVLGVEALVRWRHPERGLVPPAQFIPLAEETGLMLLIGHHVLGEACRQAGAWREARPPDAPLLLSVNVSAKQFHWQGLVDEVARVLVETGLEPRNLVLEITESTLMDGADRASKKLEELKALGISLAADNFGTGYSSLSYLRYLPLDYLNINRSYVERLGEDTGDQIISAMIRLVHSLGMKVVAEGVETADQLARLQELGCDLAQGHHFSRPLPADEVAPFLTGSTA
jgi:diguanylate cyclase (GGDEF)-like protein/PAS domain S-box-containing protein